MRAVALMAVVLIVGYLFGGNVLVRAFLVGISKVIGQEFATEVLAPSPEEIRRRAEAEAQRIAAEDAQRRAAADAARRQQEEQQRRVDEERRRREEATRWEIEEQRR